MKLFDDYDIEPIDNQIILKREVISEKTEGGLYMPGTSVGKSNIAAVLACGPGLRDDSGNRLEMQVSVGDVVVLDEYSGQEIKIEGDTVVIARETEIRAILRRR